MIPAVSLRDALAASRVRRRTRPLAAEAVIADYVRRYAGVPATSRSAPEPIVVYPVAGSPVPVLLGAYGNAGTVRGWLPGLPPCATPATAAALVAAARRPVTVADPACQQAVRPVDLTALPVPTATPRDGGPYLTMGLVHAFDARTGEQALSAHRMLVLDADRLAVWMVPGRQLRAMHAAALRRGEVLPVSVNLGAPPAAVIAAALNTRFLPPGTSKLDMAGALAGAPISMAAALTQPVPVLAESEIVLEGFLGAETADETLTGVLGRSMPEFLGYDGDAQAALPVLTVTGCTSRTDPLLQAVAGPGREQSVVLGLAGALSVALSMQPPASADPQPPASSDSQLPSSADPRLPGPIGLPLPGPAEGQRSGLTSLRLPGAADRRLPVLTDLQLSPAGGGMLLLVATVAKGQAGPDLGGVAERIFGLHPFVKLIVFVDDDVDPGCAEDVLWAIVTRANLAADCRSLAGFAALRMDPSQRPEWARARGQAPEPGRSFIDATTPAGLTGSTARSFSV